MKNREEFLRCVNVQLFCFFLAFLLCKATTKHAYNGARPYDVLTPSAGTTTRRPGRILGRRYAHATATTTWCSWRSCKRLNQTRSNKLYAIQCTKANSDNASYLQMLLIVLEAVACFRCWRSRHAVDRLIERHRHPFLLLLPAVAGGR
jgi:hypothetical protein